MVKKATKKKAPKGEGRYIIKTKVIDTLRGTTTMTTERVDKVK